MVRCGLSEVVTISKNALLLLCVKSSTPEKGSATFDFASRAGLTPSPTCLPGQGGSRKGMWPLRQRNGSHERQPSSVKPMEGFSMSKVRTTAVDLFTPDEHAILAEWFERR